MQQRNFKIRKQIEMSMIVILLIILSLSVASAFVHRTENNLLNHLFGKCGSEKYTDTLSFINAYCSLIDRHCVKAQALMYIEKNCDINPFDFDSNLKISLIVFVVVLCVLNFAKIIFIVISETKAYHYLIIIGCLLGAVIMPLGCAKWIHSKHGLMIYKSVSGKMDGFHSNGTKIPDANFKFSTGDEMAKFYCKSLSMDPDYLVISGKTGCSTLVNSDAIIFMCFVVVFLIAELVVCLVESNYHRSGYEEMSDVLQSRIPEGVIN